MNNPYQKPNERTEKILRRLSYGSVEERYKNGNVSDAEWQWYQWEWRNSAVRFSHLAERYEAGSP